MCMTRHLLQLCLWPHFCPQSHPFGFVSAVSNRFGGAQCTMCMYCSKNNGDMYILPSFFACVKHYIVQKYQKTELWGDKLVRTKLSPAISSCDPLEGVLVA